MKNKINKLLYLIIYIFILLSYLSLILNVVNIKFSALIILYILIPILSITSIVINLLNKDDNKYSLKFCLISKLILVTFYIVNFMIWLLITMGMLVVPGLPIFIFIIFIHVGWTYLIMLSTSSLAIKTYYKIYKENKITTKTFIKYTILQFFFCLDIISFIIFYIKYKKKI